MTTLRSLCASCVASSVCVCVCVCVCACVYLCVYVCVCMRERERCDTQYEESLLLCVYVRDSINVYV